MKMTGTAIEGKTTGQLTTTYHDNRPAETKTYENGVLIQ